MDPIENAPEVEETSNTEPVEQTSEIPENSEAQEEDGEAQSTDVEEGTPAVEEAVEVKPKNGFERRAQKLTAKAKEFEQEAAFWKKTALEAGAKPPAVSAPSSDAKPTFAEFNDVEAYASAVAEWTANKVVTQALTKREQESAAQSVQKTYEKRVQEFKAVTPDFDDAFEDLEDVQLAPEIVESVMESEVGPQLAYHLAKNLDTVTRLNALSPNRRLIEIGKLEERFATKPAKAAEVKKVSSAPTPTKTPNAKAGTSKNWEDMSPEEFIKERNKVDRYRR